MQRVVLEGDKELAALLTQMVAGLETLNEPAGHEAAALVAEAAEARAPVRTGRLRTDLRTYANKRNAGIRVGRKSVPYAGPVVGGYGSPGLPRRQGGYNSPPNPFIFSAADDRARAVVDTYERFVNALIDHPDRMPTARKYKRTESE